ncbi:MAG: GMC family oxidoreductase N-terminal domain-containing protein [Geminicoccaceae bacterium]
MLSGIGPAEHLRAHGLSVQVDLPGVGGNLQDHHEVPVAAAKRPSSYFGEDRGWRMLRNGLQYVLFGTGPVTTTGVGSCCSSTPTAASAPLSSSIACRSSMSTATWPRSARPGASR